MPSETFAERILRFVQAKGYRPQQIEEIARALGIAEEEQGDFHAACRALMRTGRVVLGSSNALLPPSPPGKIVGIFRGNPRGFGFVVPEVPDTHGDLYIPAGATLDAMTGDTVRALVRRRGGRGGKRLHEGRIVEILQRGQSRFVGELQHQGPNWFVLPDGYTLHVPITITDRTAKGAQAGDQVVVEIVQYPTARQEAKGVIIKVLGRRGDPGVDTTSIIEQHGFPMEFSEAVLQEARAAAQSFEPRRDLAGREDLRTLPLLTIDPADARDFDDAISVKCHEDGTYELGVHIADVGHFVKEGAGLDAEARERANSVYLPRMVIPMLPEVLSNGVCSLQERQPRLTKSVFITYGSDGTVRAARFANSVIRSMKRLTYEQASAVLEGKRGRMSAKVVALLEGADRLARVIRARRLREGMLVLDLPEVEPVFDADGRVTDVRPADRSFSHTLIEMFMIEANEAVARLFAGLDVPCLRRIHDAREDLADGSLQRFLRVLGHSLPKSPDRFDLQALLDGVRETPESFSVHLAILRSMKQAEYSPEAIGHFALASEHYCHFTSPIRRYPDLSVHRLLERYLLGELVKPPFRGDGKQARSPRPGRLISHRRTADPGAVLRLSVSARSEDRGSPGVQDLATLGAHCSANERRAEAAERELTLVLTLRLLEKSLGSEVDGVVTGVANIGVYVQLEKYLIDGLLRFENLLDDWWRVDPSHGAVIGERSGRRITVGDRLKVVLSRIHLPTRQLDLALAKLLGGVKSSKPSKAVDRKLKRRRERRSLRASLRGARRSHRG